MKEKGAGKREKKDKVDKINSLLIENFAGLQKSFTSLAVKVDSLTSQISSLLHLFEISAKSFAEKIPASSLDMEKDRQFLDKIDKLIEQNRLVAKSLTLMEQQLRERVSSPQPRPMMIPRASSQSQEYSQSISERLKSQNI